MENEQEQPPLGRRIAVARMAAGLSKRAAAQRAGISEGRWRQVESGYERKGGRSFPTRPKTETVLAMARAVGMDPGAALDLAGITYAPPGSPAPARQSGEMPPAVKEAALQSAQKKVLTGDQMTGAEFVALREFLQDQQLLRLPARLESLTREERLEVNAYIDELMAAREDGSDEDQQEPGTEASGAVDRGAGGAGAPMTTRVLGAYGPDADDGAQQDYGLAARDVPGFAGERSAEASARLGEEPDPEGPEGGA